MKIHLWIFPLQEAFQAELAKLRSHNHADGDGTEAAQLKQMLEKALADKEALERSNQVRVAADEVSSALFGCAAVAGANVSCVRQPYEGINLSFAAFSAHP